MDKLKAIVLCCAVTMFAALPVNAQRECVTPVTSIHIVDKTKLPLLTLEEGSLQFSDADGNKVIDPNEQCFIQFRVRNSGGGDAFNCTAKLSARGSTDDIVFNATTTIPTIRKGMVQTVSIPISVGMNTTDGSVEFSMQVDEPNHMGIEAKRIAVTTRGFVAPLVQVNDYSLDPAGITKLSPFTLTVLVQNTKQGVAENVTAKIVLPDNVTLLNGQQVVNIGKLVPGEIRALEYTLITNNYYTVNTIPITINLSELHGRYAEDSSFTLSLEEENRTDKVVAAVSTQAAKQKATFNSDVDKNIPKNTQDNENTFAFIIANENYQNAGFAPVQFAQNDGMIFEQYCLNTLGLPKDNVRLRTDATFGGMRAFVQQMKELADFTPNAHFIFYYAGHGAPMEGSEEAYLVPVDAYQVNEQYCYKLQDLYNTLNSMADDRVTVFLDACFSGSTRDNTMLANARAVAIKPKSTQVSGNVVVFTAASGAETALPYQQEGHGLFTYYLLKKLQESQGDVTYDELQNYLYEMVGKKSRVNDKKQTPHVLSSYDLGDGWKSWKLRETK